AARSAELPTCLLADGLRGDQLPPLLRRERPGRDPHGSAGGLRSDSPAAAEPDRRRKGAGLPDRPPGRPLGPSRVPAPAAAGLPRALRGRREDPRPRRAAAGRLAGRWHGWLRAPKRSDWAVRRRSGGAPLRPAVSPLRRPTARLRADRL